MKMTRAFIGVCLAWLVLSRSAEAGLVYRYVFDQPTYVVQPGKTFLVSVSLQETVTDGDTSRLATDGLFSAGVRVRFDGSPAQVLSLNDILPNTAEFDDDLFLFTKLVPGSHAEFTETIALDPPSPPVLGSAVGPDTFQILLGSFRFTAGSAPEQGSILALDIPETSDTITETGLVLDPLISPAVATITAVPEPSSLTLLGIGVLGLLGYSRRRRRRSLEQRI